MNFVDKTLVRLAVPTTREAVFDQLSLEHLLRAAYETETMNVGGPFSAIYEEFRLGVFSSRTVVAQGFWGGSGGSDQKEIRVEIADIGANGSVRVDALWRGAIVARTAVGSERITNVQTAWPTANGIDDDIVAALGALPADRALREQERRTRYLARLRNALAQPATMTDEVLDQWLHEAGVGTVSDLIERLQTAAFGATRVTYAESVAPEPSPKAMPVAVALLIRDAGFSVTELLAQSKQAREQLEPSAGRAENPSTLLRQALVIGWVVPAQTFADDDWPTKTHPADPAGRARERRELAGAWLANEGVGLVVV